MPEKQRDTEKQEGDQAERTARKHRQQAEQRALFVKRAVWIGVFLVALVVVALVFEDSSCVRASLKVFAMLAKLL